ncbi:uncharacterized protein LOC134831667 [Culicoides brevitarsis]|uniref:uncharacterized protein LOC134831667 n=1 Tax=Culicoides brevitarsis TaxID=469753 RepID=UPI00307CAC84
MKIYLFLLSLGVSCVFAANDTKSDVITEANMNAYMDYVLIQFGPFINSMGWIPMDLPDIVEGFEAKPILITYRGELKLTNGVLDEFQGTARSGNSMMYYDKMLLRVSTSTNLRNIRYRFDYSAKIWNLGPTGWLEGGTDKFIMHTDILIDITDFYIYMQDFRVEKIGSVWTKLHGNILVDWLANAIINTMSFIFRGILRDFISDKFRENVQEVIDEINNNMHGKFSSVEDVVQYLAKMSENGFVDAPKY